MRGLYFFCNLMHGLLVVFVTPLAWSRGSQKKSPNGKGESSEPNLLGFHGNFAGYMLK